MIVLNEMIPFATLPLIELPPNRPRRPEILLTHIYWLILLPLNKKLLLLFFSFGSRTPQTR